MNRPRRRRSSAAQLGRAADDQLLTTLYTVHGDAVRRFVAGHVVDVQHREDVVQETFARAWKNIDQIDTDGNPRSFLFTVARHILIDRNRRNAIVRMDPLEDVASLNVLIDEVTPERQASAEQQLQRLSRLLQRLPARCREVVWMRRVENVPQKVIARRLDIAEATVEKHLVRGIRLLADAFHGGEDPHDD